MKTPTTYIPSSELVALQWLLPLLDKPMDQVPPDPFKQAWAAVFYLYPGLHPDFAIEHGTELTTEYDGPEEYRQIEPRLIVPRYDESGWPVVLAPLAEEAWRRYELDLLEDDEFYCSDAQHKGMTDRMRDQSRKELDPLKS